MPADDNGRPLSDGSSPPLVSVIVVNWNGAAFVERCIDALLEQTHTRTEIIVVDNGSVDGSLELLTRRYGARIGLVPLQSNTGFAGGVNAGIRVSRGDWIALINNDAIAEGRWLESLIECGEQNPRIGMCASRIYLRGLDGVIDGTGLLLSRDGIGRGRGRLERDRPEFDEEVELLMPSGCAALYRRAMFDEVGLFDEDFFAYCEDSDLGLRGRLAGWRCRYAPKAIVHHDYSRSSSPYSTFKAFQVERNRIWVVVKCFPTRDMIFSVAYSVARYLNLLFGALSGRGGAAKLRSQTSLWKLPWTVLSAWFAAVRALPVMWVRRREIQSRARISASEFRNWLEAYGISARDVALKE